MLLYEVVIGMCYIVCVLEKSANTDKAWIQFHSFVLFRKFCCNFVKMSGSASCVDCRHCFILAASFSLLFFLCSCP